MQVQEFQCQIAQAQIARYLAGEPLSGEAIEQLNAHVAQCVNCKAVIAQRRAELQDRISKTPRAAVGGDLAPVAVVQNSGPATTADTAEILETVETGQPTRTIYLKPLLLSGALALVLVAMSVIARDPTSLFGKRASDVAAMTAPSTKPAPTPPPASAPTPVDSGSQPANLGGPVGTVDADGNLTIKMIPNGVVELKPGEPIDGARAPEAGGQYARTNRRSIDASAQRPKASTRVVVYDPAGNVITPTGDN